MKNYLKLKNGARGKVFYGLHCYPGVAYYADTDDMIYLSGSVLKKMDPSFSGCPVYVHHNDAPDCLDETRKTADGWVVRSFYNVNDGKHWAQFVIVTDRGEKAIRKGWKLSNCYTPKQYGKGGTWNGIEYENEVLDGGYDHLAIVPNPRYAESIILTPEEFEQYNQSHSDGFARLANSLKGSRNMAFSLFKRQKVETDKRLKNSIIQLDKSGLEVRFEDLVEYADQQALKHMKNSKKSKKSNSTKDDDEDDSQEIAKLKKKLKNAMNQIEELKSLISNSDEDDEDDSIENASDEDDEDDMENSDEDDEMENEDDDEDDDDKKKKSSKNSGKKNKKNRRNSEFDDFIKGVKDTNKRKLGNAERDYKKTENDDGDAVIYDARARLQKGKSLFG